MLDIMHMLGLKVISGLIGLGLSSFLNWMFPLPTKALAFAPIWALLSPPPHSKGSKSAFALTREWRWRASTDEFKTFPHSFNTQVTVRVKTSLCSLRLVDDCMKIAEEPKNDLDALRFSHYVQHKVACFNDCLYFCVCVSVSICVWMCAWGWLSSQRKELFVRFHFFFVCSAKLVEFCYLDKVICMNEKNVWRWSSISFAFDSKILYLHELLVVSCLRCLKHFRSLAGEKWKNYLSELSASIAGTLRPVALFRIGVARLEKESQHLDQPANDEFIRF